MLPLCFSLHRRTLVSVPVLLAIAFGLLFWPRTSPGQVQYFKMFGNAVPGDGTTAVYPSNYGAAFIGTQPGCYTYQGFFQGGSSFYQTGESIPPGCEGRADTSPPGYFLERVEPVVISGDTQVDFTVYSQYAWLSGTIKNAVTGATITTLSSAAAYGNCFNTKTNATGPNFSFGGTPGQPNYGGGLTMCRTGWVGPGQDTFRMVGHAGSDYFDETQYLALTSGQQVSGYQIALYPSQGNIQGAITDAFTGAPVSTCTRAVEPNKLANCTSGTFTFASPTQPPDWGLYLAREGDTGPGSRDFTLIVTPPSPYAGFTSPPIHVTSGQTTSYDIKLVPFGFSPDLGPCDKGQCEQELVLLVFYALG